MRSRGDKEQTRQLSGTDAYCEYLLISILFVYLIDKNLIICNINTMT